MLILKIIYVVNLSFSMFKLMIFFIYSLTSSYKKVNKLIIVHRSILRLCSKLLFKSYVKTNKTILKNFEQLCKKIRETFIHLITVSCFNQFFFFNYKIFSFKKKFKRLKIFSIKLDI